jgi:hypothetical protein
MISTYKNVATTKTNEMFVLYCIMKLEIGRTEINFAPVDIALII